jgi:hypothetical protein
MRSDIRRILEVVFVIVVGVSLAACPSRSKETNGFGASPSPPTITNIIPAAAAAILEQPDQFELLSLNPQVQQRATGADYHGFRVTGTVVINDPETRQRLVSSFERAVAENQGTAAACFNPRHGMRVTRNHKQVEFVICFECNRVRVFGAVQGEFLVTNSAQASFESVLHNKAFPAKTQARMSRVYQFKGSVHFAPEYWP